MGVQKMRRDVSKFRGGSKFLITSLLLKKPLGLRKNPMVLTYMDDSIVTLI
jgi:hypothetical protein